MKTLKLNPTPEMLDALQPPTPVNWRIVCTCGETLGYVDAVSLSNMISCEGNHRVCKGINELVIDACTHKLDSLYTEDEHQEAVELANGDGEEEGIESTLETVKRLLRNKVHLPVEGVPEVVVPFVKEAIKTFADTVIDHFDLLEKVLKDKVRQPCEFKELLKELETQYNGRGELQEKLEKENESNRTDS